MNFGWVFFRSEGDEFITCEAGALGGALFGNSWHGCRPHCDMFWRESLQF
jgi:hypothetical protein